jgi:hypothetical protein
MGLLAKAASWRRLLLEHPDARGIPATITDQVTIQRREQKKRLFAEQTRQLGVTL